jgi:hypothetical protein
MSEISVTSDMSVKGTVVSVDGKKPKGEITDIHFRMYSTVEWHDNICSDPIPVIALSYNVKETMDDGTEKSTNFTIEKRGADDEISDSKPIDTNPSPEAIMDFLKKKMQGKI